MRLSWLPTTALLIVIASAGCRTTALPNLAHPGTTKQQQNRAIRYDPYPTSEEIGGNIDGLRPREYQVPISEPSRAQWHNSKDNAEKWKTNGSE
jgi:hypothetical protein